MCKAYGVHSVTSDNYASGFSQNLIRSAGLGFEPAKKHKSELYLDPLLSLLNSQRITLPRNERLVNQIASLERSTQRSGRDFIDHPTHGHDDLSNSVAGAADLVFNFMLFDIFTLTGAPRSSELTVEQEAERRRAEADAWHRAKLTNYLASFGAFGWPPRLP